MNGKERLGEEGGSAEEREGKGAEGRSQMTDIEKINQRTANWELGIIMLLPSYRTTYLPACHSLYLNAICTINRR